VKAKQQQQQQQIFTGVRQAKTKQQLQQLIE
jgi:hypothetical protein